MHRIVRPVVLFALAAAPLAGCLEPDCYESRTKTYWIAEPPPMDVETLVRDCEADATRCKPLCERVVWHEGAFPPPVTSCRVTHHATSHELEITYEAFQSGGHCGEQLVDR